MTSQAKQVTCPKCNGNKRHSQWSHIVKGDCFTCGATGKVDISTAKQHGYIETVQVPCYSIFRRDARGELHHYRSMQILENAKEWARALRDGDAEGPGDPWHGVVLRRGTMTTTVDNQEYGKICGEDIAYTNGAAGQPFAA